jgi:rhodanese-related sulfurtransferase
MRIRMSLAALAAVALTAAGCGDDDVAPSQAVATIPGAASPVAPAQEAQDGSFVTVTPAEIAPRLVAGEVFLVDVREDEEWEAGRASFATHIPLAEVGDRLDEIREGAAGRPVAFICRSGNRSAQASQTAVDGGVTDVINVDGGMGAWVDAGLPIVPADGTVL